MSHNSNRLLFYYYIFYFIFAIKYGYENYSRKIWMYENWVMGVTVLEICSYWLHMMIHDSSPVYCRPVTAWQSRIACSRSFSLRFSLISRLKYVCIRFWRLWSRLLASALPTALFARQIGQLSICFFCAFIKHRTQNTWLQARRMGRQAIAIAQNIQLLVSCHKAKSLNKVGYTYSNRQGSSSPPTGV